MSASAAAPYSSRLIHLGMDETYGLGRGSTLRPGRAVRPGRMYLRHLRRVIQCAVERGLRPMIWGDMLLHLRLTKAGIRREVGAGAKGLGVVYWQYDLEKEGEYKRRIEQYRALGFEPLIAPAVWNWGRFWGFYDKAAATIAPFMSAAKQAGVKRAMLTMWGDDGQESPFASNYPALALFAEHCWRGRVALPAIRDRTRVLCGDRWESFVAASRLDGPGRRRNVPMDNLAKCLLYDDPLLGVYAAYHDGREYGPHYRRLSGELRRAVGRATRGNRELFSFAAELAACLSVKADLRGRAYRAYRAGDRREIGRVIAALSGLMAGVERLWAAHRRIWMKEYKAHGFEVLDLRYGGLVARLRVMRERLSGYQRGEIKVIEEFAAPPRRMLGKLQYPVLNYGVLASVSAIR